MGAKITEPLSFYSAWAPWIEESKSFQHLISLIMFHLDWPEGSIYQENIFEALFVEEESKAEELIGIAHWVHEGLPI